ncbi:NAD(P)-binding Rossmann-like domain protein, partial [Bacteriovorax sp. BSW11_IV]|uniref:FAD-dependent oxidoreductase n=1 Tax=Bacteriovorax sp. BSW11_IV TaxID=1353529 RepID=UPI00038A3652
MKKIAVVGGGYSGLSIAALLAKSGVVVDLFEKHSSLGGCAGYFVRKNISFDVGATTISGLKKNGPTRKLIETLGLRVNFLKEHNGISFICEDGKLNLSSDIEKTKESFKEIFPDFPT